MDNSKDGLSRKDRLKRITSVSPFSALDNGQESLLEQSLEVARFLRYYNLNKEADGYFDALLESSRDPDFFGNTRPEVANGMVEPSQALLLIFLENLHKTTQDFNERWRKYPLWYLKDVLKVKSLPLLPNKTWISLEKKPFETVTVKEGTRFVTTNKAGRPLYYKISESIELLDTQVTEGYILNFEKDNKRVPEKYLDFVTAVKVKQLKLQGNETDTSKHLKTVGLKITSPALLLREGERSVTITFYDENNWTQFLLKNVAGFMEYFSHKGTSMPDEEFAEFALAKFFSNIFYLSVSTTEGWKNIPEYTVTRGKEENSLVLKFTLDESFPATSGCTFEKHKFVSKYPKLNVHLNFDAWMYPYSWMKEFMLHKVKIETEVSDISNLHIYNELGKVDSSKPFTPFGINNEKGSWFAVGNYEMAIKNTKSIDVDIQWRQLPLDKTGLYGYYSQYDSNINNASFTLQSRFLTDYVWKETPNKSKFYLFSTAGRKEGQPIYNAPLINETRFENIDVEKMPVVKIEEEEYEFNLKSRSGFVDFIFETPDMGFGETVYRKLFTEQIMKSARKDQKYPTINPPINPLVERITLSYRAEDIINLHENTSNSDSAVDSILPIDSLSTFPKSTKKAIPFAVDIEESNLLLALKNVVPGKLFSLFFDFVPSLEEIGEQDIPNIKWYIGNMRKWQPMPPGFIQKDETRRLSVDGRMMFIMPDSIDASLFDADGQLWIRGGISIKNQTVVIPKLQAVYLNAVSLELELDFNENDKVPFKEITAKLEPEKNIPGINDFKQITSFYDGREYETDHDMFIRISEHITHQGKAVTPRDYERITLQAFPDIAKAKCYRDPDDRKSSNVYMAIIPSGNFNRPLASNYAMVKIERFLRKLTTAYVANIKVTNPVYEEILVRAVLKYNGEYLSEARRKQILQKINSLIAPWQGNEALLPEFGYSIKLRDIYNALCSEIKSEITVVDFAVIRIERNGDEYKLYEYTDPNLTITPKKPNIIFIPETEHIIHIEGVDGDFKHQFGIDEMKLGDTFIIE
ncbi:baseplate J/gp47 family protein [Flavobacterium hauense]